MSESDLAWAIMICLFMTTAGGSTWLLLFMSRRHRGELASLRGDFLTSKHECGEWMRRCLAERKKNASLNASLKAAQAVLLEEREDTGQWQERWAAEVRRRARAEVAPADGQPAPVGVALALRDENERGRETQAKRRIRKKVVRNGEAAPGR